MAAPVDASLLAGASAAPAQSGAGTAAYAPAPAGDGGFGRLLSRGQGPPPDTTAHRSEGSTAAARKAADGSDLPADGKDLPPWMLALLLASGAAPATPSAAAGAEQAALPGVTGGTSSAAGNTGAAAEAAAAQALSTKPAPASPSGAATAARSMPETSAAIDVLADVAQRLESTVARSRIEGRVEAMSTPPSPPATLPPALPVAGPPGASPLPAATAAPGAARSAAARGTSNPSPTGLPPGLQALLADHEVAAAEPAGKSPIPLVQAAEAMPPTADALRTSPDPLLTPTAQPDRLLQVPTPATPAAPTPTAIVQIDASPLAPEWGQKLGERVTWLASNDFTNAQIRLNPPHLGPVEVRVSIANDQANVWFGTHSHVTREAIEAATPRLREMLGAQGFTQVNVNVAQHSWSERPPQAERYAADSRWSDSTGVALPAPLAATQRAHALLDAYA